MHTSRIVLRLSSLIAVVSALAAGLFYDDAGVAFTFTTLRGASVQIDGRGLYRFDTILIATGYRVGDAVTLGLGIPLLVWSLWLYRRGSLKGGLLLAGTLAYFLYTYGSLALGAAYNNLFLLYLVILAAALFGLAVVLASFDLPELPACFAPALPRRGIAIFLVVAGTILLCVWLLLSILPALLAGLAPPEVASYTTVITFVLDMAIVAPALIVSGVLLLKRAPLGYLLASALLVFSAVLGIQLAAMGIVQFLAGLFGIGQFVGMVLSFAALALCALWFSVVLLRNVVEPAEPRPASVRAVPA